LGCRIHRRWRQERVCHKTFTRVSPSRSPSKRDYMIDNMHHIYECAVFAICALSSTSSDSGLSGISVNLNREPQHSTSTPSGVFLVSGFGRFTSDLHRSPWLKRGWTLQEAILSRRRLCFGDSGVFLVCQEEIFHERLSSDSEVQQIHCEPAFNYLWLQ